MDKLTEKQMEMVEAAMREIMERLQKENVVLETAMLDVILNKIAVAIHEGEEKGDQEQKLKWVKVDIMVSLITASRTSKHLKKALKLDKKADEGMSSKQNLDPV